jgi:hypothetical protein
MLFEKFLDSLPAFAKPWFEFMKRLMMTAALGCVADNIADKSKTGFWLFNAAFVVSALLIVISLVRRFLELFRQGFELLPWNRIESLPKVAAYPVAIVVGLFGVVVVCSGYQTLSVGIVFAAQLLGKMHATLD